MSDLLKHKLENIHSEFDYSIDAVLLLTTIKKKYVRMYEKFIDELRSYSKAVRILSKGYLPIYLIMPSKLEAILQWVQAAITKSNQDYEIVLNRLYLYYDMKFVTFGIDYQKNLIIQFPVFVQPNTQIKLTLYQVETVPVSILDSGNKIQSDTQLKIEKPYIALNDETYITICPQELSNCKRISYKYFCEELFVVKSKHQYSCASAVYFNSSHNIKENRDFYYYHNKGHNPVCVANWSNYKRIIRTYNNNIPVSMPSHPYILLNKNVLCNCNIEAESNFLLESLAACDKHDKPDLEMYFMVNLAFIDYLVQLNVTLNTPINRNWMSVKQPIPISLHSFQINPRLMHAPIMLKDFMEQYQEKRMKLPNMKTQNLNSKSS